VKSKCGLSGQELLLVLTKLVALVGSFVLFFAAVFWVDFGSYIHSIGLSAFAGGVVSVLRHSFYGIELVYEPSWLLYLVGLLPLGFLFFLPPLACCLWWLLYGLFIVCVVFVFMLYRAYNLPLRECSISTDKDRA
jgi:hypothetical protein